MSNAIIKNATIVLGVKQGDVDFKLPNLQPVIEAREKEVDVIQEAIEAQEKYNETQEKLEQQQRQTTNAAIEQAQQIGEGIMSMSRGFVLLGVSGEENLRKVLEQLAKVQAAFDLFRGATNIVKALTNAQDGLAAATARLTSITIADTAATVANTAAKTAALAATNPLITALAALAATVTAVAMAEEDEAQAARDRMKLADEQLRGLERQLQVERDLAELRGEDTGQLDVDQARQTAAAINEQVKALREKRNELRIAADTLSTSEIIGIETFGILGSDNAAQEQELIEINRKISELRAQQTRAKLEEKRATDAIAEAEKKAAEEQQKAQDEQIRKEQQLAREAERRREQQERITEQMKRQAQASENALRSQQAAVGRLSGVERARLESIIQRREQGDDLSRGDLDFLGGLGGGFSRFSQDRFAERGQDANRLLGRLGVTAEGRTVDEQLATVKEAGDKLRDGVQDVFDNVNIALESMSGKLEDVVRRIARTEDEAVQGAD